MVDTDRVPQVEAVMNPELRNGILEIINCGRGVLHSGGRGFSYLHLQLTGRCFPVVILLLVPGDDSTEAIHGLTLASQRDINVAATKWTLVRQTTIAN